MPPSVSSNEHTDGIDHNQNGLNSELSDRALRRYFLRISPTETIALLFIVLAFLPSNLFLGSIFLSALSAYIYMDYGDFIYRSYLTLHRDLSGLYLIIIIKTHLWLVLKQNRPLHEIFLDVVKKNLNKLAMIDIETSREFTFKEFNEHCNRYANYFQKKGYRKGDVVALYMENSVEFVAAWMGLAKLGCVSSWINSNLKREQLAHCIATSQAKAIITSATLQNLLLDAIKEGILRIDTTDVLVLGEPAEKTEFRNFLKELNEQQIAEPLKKDYTDFRSVLCFIYTSGTTGMPKAAVMKHFRYYSIVYGAAKSFGIRSADRVYVSMPIYHTAAGILGVGQTIVFGSTCVIRKKFSASNFWHDCVKYDCTASQYIGEICRYLLAQPVVSYEKMHQVRLMYGNGLRAEIWQPFVERFGVQIGELYGSTEGTSSLVNIDGKVGACGFLPISPLTKTMHPVRLVKVDDMGRILRGVDGLCIACNPGESGAMVSTIRKNNPLLQFEGYLNAAETNKKIIHNVFAPEDSCFVTGDLLHWDRLGYVYFRDRTGDTFRWKGENVSTTEVEAILQPVFGVQDATVYGVTVPHREGRAGMAAIVKAVHVEESDDEFIASVGARLVASLAPYAVPIFLRLCDSVDRTGTYKLVKTNLQKMGYKLEVDSSHKLFIYEPKQTQYVPLTRIIESQVNQGTYTL